jgi:ABC-type Fe3+/spermidine/putrescine transport system ATPase subunit
MMMKSDKLRGECENSRATEELAVYAKEVEQLKEQLQSRDKEWQARLRAETDRWQARLEEYQQDVATQDAKMAATVAGKICLCFFGKREKQVPVYRVMCCYISLSDYSTCQKIVLESSRME